MGGKGTVREASYPARSIKIFFVTGEKSSAVKGRGGNTPALKLISLGSSKVWGREMG